MLRGPNPSLLRCFLYCSVLAADQTPVAITQIVHAARHKNRHQGITGVLVFDGLAFAHYLEGPPAAIAHLKSELLRDDRHVALQVLHEATVDAPRAFPNWALGFGICTDIEAFQRLEGHHGLAAFERFRAMLTECDVEA